MYSYCELLAGSCPDEHLPLIRELISYDVQSPNTCSLVRGSSGELYLQQPAPMHWSRQIEWPWALVESCLQPHHAVLDLLDSFEMLIFCVHPHKAVLAHVSRKELEEIVKEQTGSDGMCHVLLNLVCARKSTAEQVLNSLGAANVGNVIKK